jgi:carbamoyl-phosphate synthase small subunit
MKGKLILENGVIFEGNIFGYLEDSVGEVVFNTGMTGYQEVLTDPSYYGQIVTMTYPLIGNYGINLEDMESKWPKVRGFIVREKCDYPNNFRCEMELEGYFKQNKIIGLEGIDTRALTKILRTNGTMKGIIATKELSQSEIKQKFSNFDNSDAVRKVTTEKAYTIQGNGAHVAVMDFGIKENILRSFKERGCKLTVFPSNAKAEEILNVNPDLIFLSNGPGDPEDLHEVIDTLKHLVDKKPVVGICLGHQLLAIALGGKTEKLKFGHRGCNHPVKDIEENKVYITTQNHGYYVSLLPQDMKITHVSVNDGTIEGMRHESLPIFSVQFHPEACPGPKDIDVIFDKFLSLI